MCSPSSTRRRGTWASPIRGAGLPSSRSRRPLRRRRRAPRQMRARASARARQGPGVGVGKKLSPRRAYGMALVALGDATRRSWRSTPT